MFFPPNTLLIVGAVLFMLMACVTLLSLHKKTQIHSARLIDSRAISFSHLDPEGSVLVDGELWRARSLDGMRIERGRTVVVTTVHHHLLVVEPSQV